MQRHDVERARMGGRKTDLRGAAFVMGLKEAGGAEAPLIACRKPVKAELRSRGGKVVSHIFGIGQKLIRHDGADGVAAVILAAGIARPVPEKAGQGIFGAGQERPTEDIYAWFWFHTTSL